MRDLNTIDNDMRRELMAAKSITEAAKDRGLTEAEQVKVHEHLAKVETLKAEKAQAKADGVRASIGGNTAWRQAAQAFVAGDAKIELPGMQLLAKAVSDSDLANDAQTGRAVIERPGITAELLDDRYIFGLFPSTDPGGALAVSEFKQTSRGINGSGEVERDPLSTDPKAELDVTIEHVSANMRQVAVLITDVPVALFEAEGALEAFLASEMRKQLAIAIDAHVVAGIAAASPDSSGGGSNFAESLRYAKADLLAKGVHASHAIITPEESVELDIQKEIDRPAGFPYGLSFRESPSTGTAYCLDPQIAGQLYLGQVKLERDAFTGFRTNTVDLRAEANLLFVVRNVDAVIEVTDPAS